MLKSAEYLRCKPALCFKQDRIAHDFNFSDFNAANTGGVINLSKESLGHNAVTSANIEKKAGKLLVIS